MSIEGVRADLGLVADNLVTVSSEPMARIADTVSDLILATSEMHESVEEAKARAAESRHDCEAMAVTGGVARRDLETQNSAVARITETTENDYLIRQLPAEISQLAERVQMGETAQAIGNKLGEAMGALATAAAALLECVGMAQQAGRDTEQTRIQIHRTAQGVRDHAAGM